MDAHPKVVQLAEALREEAWKPLERLPRYENATEPRCKAPRVKEAIVRFRGYLNKKLVAESVAEFDYQRTKCGRSYRLVVVRKISVSKKARRCFSKTLNTFSTSPIIVITWPKRLWLWPTGAVIRRM